MSNNVFIIGAKRTAIGTMGGSLKDISAVELGVAAAKAAIEHARIAPEQVDETIIGQILSAGSGMGPARQVSIHAGIPVESPGFSVNMLCGSGMKAVMMGAVDIMASQAEVVLAGGIENMDLAPYMLTKARYGYRMGHGDIVDHMISEGLTDVFNQYHMGVTAENLVEKYQISRLAQDEFAVTSQQKAKKAQEAGKFADEIVPFVIKGRKGDTIVDKDEHLKPDATIESLARLRPAFKKDGSVTAGNASGINDGASMTVMVSEQKMRSLGVTPLVRVVSFAQSGVDPSIMGIGPVEAVRLALKKATLSLKDMNLLELNEAFAAQSLAVIADLKAQYGLDDDWIDQRVNVNGGAIALGHPIGASGNRIIVTLIHEMKRRNVRYGLASLCIGGGMGTAIILENA